MSEHFELALYLTGDEEDWAGAIFEKYGIDYADFNRLIDDLLPLIQIAQNIITEKVFAGFADKSDHVWLSKIPVPIIKEED